MHPPQVSEWCSPSSRRCRQNSSQNCQSSGKKELGIYIVLYCVLLYTQNVLQKVMEEYLFLTTTSCSIDLDDAHLWWLRRDTPPWVCSIDLDDAHLWWLRRDTPPWVCSIDLDDAMAATVQRRQCPHNRPATCGEERDQANSGDGDYWPGGNLARTQGLHPYSLWEVPWDS